MISRIAGSQDILFYSMVLWHNCKICTVEASYLFFLLGEAIVYFRFNYIYLCRVGDLILGLNLLLFYCLERKEKVKISWNNWGGFKLHDVYFGCIYFLVHRLSCGKARNIINTHHTKHTYINGASICLIKDWSLEASHHHPAILWSSGSKYSNFKGMRSYLLIFSILPTWAGFLGTPYRV